MQHGDPISRLHCILEDLTMLILKSILTRLGLRRAQPTPASDALAMAPANLTRPSGW